MQSLLLRAKSGDNMAMDKLIQDNSALIYSVVKRFIGRGVEAEDLYQLGSIGFVKAVRGYDLSFGTQFSTYAVPKITGEIKRFLRDDGIVKVSRGVRENISKINAAQAAFIKSEGREPRISDLARLTGLQAEEIAFCIDAPTTTVSLDAEMSEGFSLYDTLQSSYDEQKLVERIALKEAIAQLDELWRKIILLRYFKGLTQQKTAEVLGMTQVQVSRIERRAFECMKRTLTVI